LRETSPAYHGVLANLLSRHRERQAEVGGKGAGTLQERLVARGPQARIVAPVADIPATEASFASSGGA
jgi:hypothetical protein